MNAGDPVAALDARDLEANLAVATAAFARSSNSDRVEHELNLAEQNLARTKELFQKRAISQARMDQDEAIAQVARTRLFEAKEQQREAELRRDAVQAAIDLRTIRAPFAAQVIRVEGQIGQTIRQAEPVLSLVNLERLKVDLHLPSTVLNDANVGQRYRLWATAPVNKPIVATLVAKEPMIDAATKTSRCRFEIDNNETEYPAGFAVGLIDLADPIHSAEIETNNHESVADRDGSTSDTTAF